MTRALRIAALAATFATTFQPPAAAASEPLVVAPPPAPPPPSLLDLAIDVALPSAAAIGVWRLVAAAAPQPGADPAAPGGAAGLFTGVLFTAGVVAPPAALVTLRERPFPLDGWLAASAGGLGGLAVGWGATRLAGGAAADPLVSALALGLGQGLGTAAAYHLYRGHKAGAGELDRLPLKRKDDPIDDWKFWRERRNP